ncbi:hypothetical protein [Gottfriedia acidiceleris]
MCKVYIGFLYQLLMEDEKMKRLLVIKKSTVFVKFVAKKQKTK